MQSELFIDLKPKRFLARLFQHLFVPGLVIAALTFWLTNQDKSKSMLVLGLTLFLLMTLYSIYKCRFYITRIVQSSDENLAVSYYDFFQLKQINSNIGSTVIYKGLLWSKQRQLPFLALQSKGQSVQIRQFPSGRWTESKMEELLAKWPIKKAYL